MLKNVDLIFESMQDFTQGYELKYNKFYIGMVKDGISKNFLSFKPRMNYLYMIFRGNNDPEIIRLADDAGLEINYTPRFKEYRLRINDFNEYKRHKELIDSFVKGSLDYFNMVDE